MDQAWALVRECLVVNPLDPRALLAGTHIYDRAKNLPVAYHFARAANEAAPTLSATWLNLGRIAEQLYREDEALKCYRRALELCKKQDARGRILLNLGALYVSMGRWKDAEETSRSALEILPDNRKAKGNLGMACLAQRKWREGWEGYGYVTALDQRRHMRYGEEAAWDGSPGKVVVVHGEQGLGDELSFASVLSDATRDCKRVVVDCDARLEGLFRRSFPKAKIYGTRWKKAVLWDEEDRTPEASIPLGELCRFYRNADEDFTGEPYLVPDPDRVRMWRALFDQKRPVIGIAWTGGVQWTGAQFRHWSLVDLLPLFRATPAHWVSLQYKDAAQEIAAFKAQHDTDVAQYKFGTLTEDYDDTAAVVAACDLVICMQTAVAHLAGAMGKECWVFVPTRSQWRYAGDSESIPWYRSVRVWHQRKDGEWSDLLRKAACELTQKFGLTVPR